MRRYRLLDLSPDSPAQAGKAAHNEAFVRALKKHKRSVTLEAMLR